MIHRTIFKYIAILSVLGALTAAQYAGMRPCGAGFCAALIYCGLPAVIIFPFYMAFSLLVDFSLASFAYTLAVIVATFAAALLGLKFRRAKKTLFAALFALSQVSLLAMQAQIGWLLLMVWGVLALGFFVASVCFLRPVLLQKLKYKLLETELVCGGLLLICASLGLGRLRVYGLDASYLMAGFCIPFAAAVGSVSASVGISVCFGAGMALSCGQIDPIAFLAFAALLSCVFVATPRPIASLSTAAAYVLVSYLFSSSVVWQQPLCFAVGALAFSCMPSKVLAKVHDVLFAPVTAMAARGIVNRAAAETGNDLFHASQIFSDMKVAMEQVPAAIGGAATLEKQMCVRCERYAVCSTTPGFSEALDKMERTSAERGRASVSEIPTLLSVCTHLPELVGKASLSAQVRHEELLLADAKCEGRKIVAQQLGLMSQVLYRMGERARRPARFDTAKEMKIAEDLAYRGAAVPEVIVTEDTVSVVLRSDDLTCDDVASAIGKIMHGSYEYVRGGEDVLPGYTLMLFARKPRYDVVFSSAAGAKEGKSGDNHSFVRLGGDRFMMALCDGMGSGEEAGRASGTAIELIENFFRAGLDSGSAVDCVNRFLALNECERFSTLDITVIDLNSGDAEIIKLSSPATVIRSGDGVHVVTGSALPMGVLEEVKCGHAHQKLRAGDQVIMATDGVTDALGQERLMAMSARASGDPAVVTKELLDCAVLAGGGKPRDDCTVLCARIFEKA